MKQSTINAIRGASIALGLYVVIKNFITTKKVMKKQDELDKQVKETVYLLDETRATVEINHWFDKK